MYMDFFISIVMIILHHRGHNHFVHLGQPKLIRAGTVTRLRFSLVKSLSQSLRSSWTLCSERSRRPFTSPSFTSMVKKRPQSLRLLTSAETSQLPMIFKMDLAQKPASQSPFLLVDESWVSLIVIGHTQKVRNLSEPHRALFQRLFFLFTCNLYNILYILDHIHSNLYHQNQLEEEEEGLHPPATQQQLDRIRVMRRRSESPATNQHSWPDGPSAVKQPNHQRRYKHSLHPVWPTKTKEVEPCWASFSKFTAWCWRLKLHHTSRSHSTRQKSIHFGRACLVMACPSRKTEFSEARTEDGSILGFARTRWCVLSSTPLPPTSAVTKCTRLPCICFMEMGFTCRPWKASAKPSPDYAKSSWNATSSQSHRWLLVGYIHIKWEQPEGFGMLKPSYPIPIWPVRACGMYKSKSNDKGSSMTNTPPEPLSMTSGGGPTATK